MKILKQSNNQYLGNDCVFYVDIALIEAQKNYIVITNEKSNGWDGSFCNCNTYTFGDYNEATRYYAKKMKEW